MKRTTVKALTRVMAMAALCGLPVLACADEMQSLAAIAQTAESWALAQLQDNRYNELHVNAGPLDSRLRLRACQQPLEAFGSVGSARSGRLTVGIRCTAPVPWSIYIPVQVHATIAVVAVAMPQNKGAVLRSDDLIMVNRSLQELPLHYISDPQMATNMALTRAVAGESLLSPGLLQEPQLVNKGQEITILAGSTRLAVKMPGTALQNGARGQRIGVRNASSGKTVEGVIVDAGTVQVDL